MHIYWVSVTCQSSVPKNCEAIRDLWPLEISLPSFTSRHSLSSELQCLSYNFKFHFPCSFGALVFYFILQVLCDYFFGSYSYRGQRPGFLIIGLHPASKDDKSWRNSPRVNNYANRRRTKKPTDWHEDSWGSLHVQKNVLVPIREKKTSIWPNIIQFSSNLFC